MSGAAGGIRLDWQDSTGPAWIGEWYFPPRPVFLYSDAYETFARELRRYVAHEVPGRSFLIAGHRGAGKTSLVNRAVLDLQREIVTDAVDNPPVAGGATGRTVGLQRPLLVKLHGAGLVTAGSAASPPSGADFWKAASAAPAAHSAERALQQITVALYRAFAREVAESYTLHARQIAFDLSTGTRRTADLPEMAGQLTMDLDQAPDIAALRQAWIRLHRLEPGILWPNSVGSALVGGGLADRGVREIVALATANQAFQVCIGTIEDKRTRKDAAAAEVALRMEGRLDAKDLANKLIGLAAGALAGGALWSAGQPAAAVGAGLATGLFSTLALGWSGTRSRRAERGADYSFIVDRSIQTLERDLPLVIERIREAGLAPVFVIDELDKVPNAGEVIRTLIDRLKSLTTDYGFFCFLTGREYYEEIAERIRARAFPTEHTYFSHRLMVLYRPAELAKFVRDLWKVDASAGQPGEAAAWVLTSYVLHQARLNTIDVIQTATELCDRSGQLKPGVERVRGGREFLVPMAIQLAIEHILRKPQLRLRTQDDPAFAQNAIDALYFISRTWVRETEVKTTAEALAKDLIDRRGIGGTGDTQRAALDQIVDAETRMLLAGQMTALADLLTSFSELAAPLAAEPQFLPTPPPDTEAAPASERDRIEKLLPMLSGLGADGLLERVGSRHYRFRYDRYGTPIAVRRAGTSGGRQGGAAVAQAIPPQVRWAAGFTRALLDMLARFDASLDALVSCGILPSSVVERTLSVAVANVASSIANGAVPGTTEADAVVVFALTARVWSRAIATVVALVDMIRADARTVGTAPTFEATLRLLAEAVADLTARANQLADVAAATGPAADSTGTPEPGSIRDMLRLPPQAPRGKAFLPTDDWVGAVGRERDRLAAMKLPRNLAALATEADMLARWRQRFTAWFSASPGVVEERFTYTEIVLAAADVLPASRLLHDLDRMTPARWSRFADATFGRYTGSGAWMNGAGLEALGFARDVVTAAQAGTVVSTAPPDRPGTLFIRRQRDSIFDIPQGGPRRGDPIYVLESWPPPDQSQRLLNWLNDLGALENVVVEDGEEDASVA